MFLLLALALLSTISYADEWVDFGSGMCTDSNGDGYSNRWAYFAKLDGAKDDCLQDEDCVGVEYGEWGTTGMIIIQDVGQDKSNLVNPSAWGTGPVEGVNSGEHVNARCFVYTTVQPVNGHYVAMGGPGRICRIGEDCGTRVEEDSFRFNVRCCKDNAPGPFGHWFKSAGCNSHQIGLPGSNYCGEHLTASECENYAKTEGLTWDRQFYIGRATWPKGCTLVDNTDIVYYNGHPAGGANSEVRPICKSGEVYGGSKVDASNHCMYGKTLNEANSWCINWGARLCTKEEILKGCAQGTGCQHDFAPVWTSSTGVVPDISLPPTSRAPTTFFPTPPDIPNYYMVVHRNTNFRCDESGGCIKKFVTIESTYPITCCRDNYKDWDANYQDWKTRNWDDSVCNDVYTESDIWSMDHEIRNRCIVGTWYDGDRICREAGGRFCTTEEIEHKCAISTGCGFDGRLIWSSEGKYVTP